MTNNEFLNKIKNKYNNHYDILEEYKGYNEKIWVKHFCGYKFQISPHDLLRKEKCKKCSKKLKKTTNSFKKEVYELVGNEYLVLGEYINNSKKIKIRHNSKECEYYKEKGEYYDYEITPHSFLQGKRCKYCSVKKRTDKLTKTHEEFLKEVKEIYPDNEYIILGKYKTDHTKIKIRHNSKECEYYKEKGEYYDYEITPHSFLQGKRCRKCCKNKKKTHEEFKQEIYDEVGDEYILENEYIDNSTSVILIHNSKECGYYKRKNEFYRWKVRPYNFLNGYRCPECSKSLKISKSEKDILQFIENIYNDNIIENDRTTLDGKELDIYLPNIKLAIEYNGCYWHNDEKYNKNYHLNKYNLCKEKDITLISIWENDYEKDKEKYYNIIKSFINNDPIYDTIYKDDLIYINKDYEDLESEIYEDQLNKYYEYIGDTLPELINRNNYNCWNIGYKIYKERVII